MQYPENNQLLFVKSNHKLSGPTSGDLYKFANPVVAKRKKRILAELVEAEIPISFYTFSSVNNFNSIFFEGNNVNETITHTFPDQTFNITELLANLNTAYNNAATNFTIAFSYNSNTFKINLLVTATGSNTQVNKIKINTTNTAHSYLGLMPNQEVNGSSSTLNMVSERGLNLNRTLNIYVKTSLKVENIDSRGVNDGTIAKLQVDVPPGEFIHYHNIENVTFLVNDHYIDHLLIKLEDDDGQLIDFNGVQYHMTFAFRYVDEKIDDFVPTLYDKVNNLMENKKDE